MNRKLIIAAILLLASSVALATGISQWAAFTGSLADGDLFGVTDISDTTQSENGSSKKITFSQLLDNLKSTFYTETEIDNAGFLTDYTETDPTFAAHEAYTISAADTTNWDEAYGWGNHANAGYQSALSLMTEAEIDTGTSTTMQGVNVALLRYLVNTYAGEGGSFNEAGNYTPTGTWDWSGATTSGLFTTQTASTLGWSIITEDSAAGVRTLIGAEEANVNLVDSGDLSTVVNQILSASSAAEIRTILGVSGTSATTFALTLDLVDGNGTDELTLNSTDYTADTTISGLTGDQTVTATADTGRQVTCSGTGVTGSNPYTVDDAEDGTARTISCTFSDQSASAATYDFEETGTPTGVTIVDGTPDFDYTSTVLSGTESFNYLSGGNPLRVEFDLDDFSTGYFAFMIQEKTDLTGFGDGIRLRDASDNVIASISLSGASPSEVTLTDGTNTTATIATMAAGSTYYIKMYYNAGSGSDGTLTAWVSTDGTTWGTPQTISNSVATGTIDHLYLTCNYASYDLLFDDFTYSASDIDF